MKLPTAPHRLKPREGGLLIAPAPRLRDRAQARVRSRRLDLALAGGVPPETSAALALRARRLTGLPYRRAAAATYRRTVREAQQRRQTRARVMPCRESVLAAADELGRLADSLARPGPVAADGAAQALLLLRDGTGPLYNAHSPASLRASAASAAANLPVHHN